TPAGRVPRFNMPIELGMAFAIKSQFRQREYRVYILEARQYRTDASASDLRGMDPLIHGNRPTRLLNRLLDILTVKGIPKPNIAVLRRVDRRLWKTARLLKKEHGEDSLFTPTLFERLVAAATVLAREEGLLKPSRKAK